MRRSAPSPKRVIPTLLFITFLLLSACTPSKADAERIALEEFKEQNARVADLLAARFDPKADPVMALQADALRNNIIEQNERAEVLKSIRHEDYWQVVVTIPTPDAVPKMDVLVYDDGRVVIPAVEEMLEKIGVE